MGVNLIQEQDEEPLVYIDTPEDNVVQYGSSVGWMNQPVVPAYSRSWDSDNSGDYVVMAV